GSLIGEGRAWLERKGPIVDLDGLAFRIQEVRGVDDRVVGRLAQIGGSGDRRRPDQRGYCNHPEGMVREHGPWKTLVSGHLRLLSACRVVALRAIHARAGRGLARVRVLPRLAAPCATKFTPWSGRHLGTESTGR